jgi:hypothetical protein
MQARCKLVSAMGRNQTRRVWMESRHRLSPSPRLDRPDRGASNAAGNLRPS